MKSDEHNEDTDKLDGVPYKSVRDRPKAGSKSPWRWTGSGNNAERPWSE